MEAARHPRPANTDLPGLTLAICTKGRPDHLRRALESALAQRGDIARLLVVDNATVAAGLPASIAGVDYAHEPHPGLSRARNRALRESHAPLVGFVDDDTVLGAGWASAMRRAMADAPEAAAVCGLVQPLTLDSPAARAVEAYGGMGRGFGRKWAVASPPPGASAGMLGLATRMGVGANMVVRREAALALGGFDEALGVGTPSCAGEDLEFLFRAVKAGHAACYEPAALVLHEHRDTMALVLAQAESWGTGMGAYLERTAAAYPEERAASRARLAWLLVSWYGRRAVASLFRPSFPASVLRSDVRGLLSGARQYRRSAPSAAPPAAPRAATGAPRSLHEAPLDLLEPLRNMQARHAGTVRLHVSAGSRRLGTVTLRAVNDHVGAARIADAVASSFRRDLLGAPDRQVALAFLDELERT